VAKAVSIGGKGGVLGVGSAEATAKLTDPLIKASIGDWSVVNAPDARLEVSAENRANLSADTKQTVTAGIANNDSKATTQISNSQTLAEVGEGADINVREFVIWAKDDSVYAEALSDARVPFELGGSNKAWSTVDVDMNPIVHIYGGGTVITATDRVEIVAGANSVNTRTYAYTKTTGASGVLYSTADNDKIVDVDVIVDSGTQINTTDLLVDAYAPPRGGDRYIRHTETHPQTVVKYVWDVVETVTTQVCNVVANIICLFGLFCKPKEVCEDIVTKIYDWVPEQITGKGVEKKLGAETISNDIEFNADVTIAGGSDPQLVIGADGTIEQKSGLFDVTVEPDRIVVGGILNAAPAGSIAMHAEGGSTSGSSNLSFNTSFGALNIINASDKDLVVNDIEVFNAAAPATLSHKASHGDRNWNFDVTTAATTSEIAITNDSASDSDIILQGYLLNPGGHVRVTNVGGGGGDILSVGPMLGYAAERFPCWLTAVR
jgi:hypothetical protein